MLILIDELERCVTTTAATPLDRLVSHLRAGKLDREIAAGASPDANAMLALRARALVRPSARQALARRLALLLEEAASGRPTSRFGDARIPISRERIVAAADALRFLMDRLLTPGPVPARGVAVVRVLLTDGTGPLYYPSDTDDLRSVALAAAEELEPLRNW